MPNPVDLHPRAAEPLHVIIVERKGNFRYRHPGCLVVNNREFITRPELLGGRPARIINLSKDYSYLGYGYYCSLLAEARNLKVLPSVATILELREKSIYRHALPELDDLLRQQLRRLGLTPLGPFVVNVFFGRTDDDRFKDLARRAFDLFRCPLLRLNITPDDDWRISSIRPMALGDLGLDQQLMFEQALEAYTRVAWRAPKAKAPRYSLAILHNPQEKMPPSSARTLQKFVKIGEGLGLEVDLVEKKDYASLAEYDALFIRETTAIDHHTFRFAKKAENEGMVVIDDPTSILRCTNKVYLAELLRAHNIPTPKTVVLDNRQVVETVEQELTYPVVLKIPDGSFSRGVIKVGDRAELIDGASRLLKESDVILAQQYIYTEFDWRIGILRGQPIYACQYFMSRNHWQVVKHEPGGRFTEGGSRTLAVEAAPPEVVSLALRAAELIGDGLYGVDLKQTAQGIYVIEINDNPSIDMGCEDAVLKDDLYRRILQEFIHRLDSRTPSALRGEPELPLTLTAAASD